MDVKYGMMRHQVCCTAGDQLKWERNLLVLKGEVQQVVLVALGFQHPGVGASREVQVRVLPEQVPAVASMPIDHHLHLPNHPSLSQCPVGAECA